MAGSESGSFCQLQDKSLLSSLQIAAWCPTMDLLAFSSADRQLCVHRLNWQRLWAVAPDQLVTSICWRPDGKIVAVGHEDGSLALYDVENGEVQHRSKVHSAPVTCLSWDHASRGAGQEGGETYVDRTPRFFSALPPPLPASGGGEAPPQAAGAGEGGGTGCALALFGGQGSKLSVLTSADSSGCICMSVHGIFPIGSLDTTAMDLPGAGLGMPSAALGPSHVHQVTVSPDLAQMTAVVAGRAAGSEGLFLLSLDTGVVGQHRGEVGQLAVQAYHVERLLAGAGETADAMEKQWGEVTKAFSDKMGALQGLISDHGSASSPRAELLAMLSCGLASPPLHQFLTSTLGEQTLRRLAKKVDAAEAAVHAMMCDHLHPALEVVAFRLGELRGLAALGRRVEALGLDAGELEAAVELAALLLVKVEGAMRAVGAMAAQRRVFFTWLLRAMRKLDGGGSGPGGAAERGPAVDAMQVAAFLEGQLESDWLGEQLSAEAAATAASPAPPVGGSGKLGAQGMSEDAMLLQGLLLGDPCGGGGAGQAAAAAGWTLRGHLRELGELCKRAFARPVGPISRAITPSRLLPLEIAVRGAWDLARAPFKAEGAAARGGEGGAEEEETTLLFHRRAEEGNTGAAGSSPVVVVRVGAGAGGGIRCAAVAVASTGEEFLRLEDVAFYRNDQLAMLVAPAAPPGEGGAPTGGAQLVLVDYSELPFVECTDLYPGEDVLSWCDRKELQAPVPEDARVRRGLHATARAPLVVSAPRGVAAVLVGQRRVLLYDMEEDEEFLGDEDDEEEGDGEGEEGEKEASWALAGG